MDGWMDGWMNLLILLFLIFILNIDITSIITLRASENAAQCIVIGPVCWFVCVCVVGVFVCLWVCFHDNSKLRASILTKLGL